MTDEPEHVVWSAGGRHGPAAWPVGLLLALLLTAPAPAEIAPFQDHFDGPALHPAWTAIQPASHRGFDGSGHYVVDGIHGTHAGISRSMGGQGSFVAEVGVQLEPFFLSGSGGTKSDFKFRFVGGSGGLVEVVLNSFQSIRVWSSQLGGNIAPPVSLSSLTDSDRLDLQVSFLHVDGSLDVKYAINGGPWVDLASASGITGHLDGNSDIVMFKFSTNPTTLPQMRLDRFEVRTNQVPSARADFYQTPQDTLLVVPAPGVLTNDTHPLSLPVSAVLGSNAPLGSVTLDADGGFSYQPPEGYSGLDTFVYHAEDGTNASAPATVTIDVTPQPKPVANPNIYQTTQGTALVVPAPGIMANDTHPLGLPMSAVLVSNASFGVVALDADGGFDYQPPTEFSGFDDFTYHVTDGTHVSPPAAVTIEVTPPPRPIANLDAYQTPQNTAIEIPAPGVLANDTHPLGLPMSAVLVSNASFGVVALSTNGGFNYQPPTGFSGFDSFIYQVTDVGGVSAPTVVTIGVTPPPSQIVHFEALAPGANEFRIDWNSRPQKVYTIERTSRLEGGWQPIATNVPATSPTNSYVLSQSSHTFEAFRISEEGRLGVLINEFMASTSAAGIEDPDEPGEYPDWVELHNSSSAPIDISGWYMTDDLGVPDKFQVPGGTVPALGFLLLYADDDPEQGPDHLGFKLSAGGEAIGLSADGMTFVDSITFGTQTEDESHGRDPERASTWTPMITPTPANPNHLGYLAEVTDTTFSVDRGFFTRPFTVEITSATADADIYYTTDFSEPTAGTGILYVSPIAITNTTCLRAAAFRDGWKPTKVATHTYIFVDDVLTQPADPPGWPDKWRLENPLFPPDAIYGMDPSVVGAYPWAELTNALLSIASVSIVTDMDHLFHPDTGIYTHPEQRDQAGEKPCSVEWIQPDGSPGIGVNCGLRIQGNWARMFAKKRPFRLLFKSTYGPATLEYPVFGADSATDSFNTIVLRSNAQGDPETQTEDEFSRRLVRRMGHPQSHGTYVHLYVNGLYWGLYNPAERPMSAFCEEYMGGEREDWDAHNANGQGGGIDGSMDAWNGMNSLISAGLADNASYQRIQGNNPDGSANPAYPPYLDVDNYLDYILYNFWGNVADWPKAGDNWYGGRYRPGGSTGYKFFIWDAEAAFNTGNETAVTAIPAHAHAALKQNAEYLLRFGDHTHRHMFNDGVLTPESTESLYTQMMAEVGPFIMLDEARWSGWTNTWNGDNWISAARYHGRVNYITNHYLPNRTATVVDQFRNAGLYPETAAPVFQIGGVDQHGGSIASGSMLSMTNAASDTVYYTLDGTDPREYGTGSAIGMRFTTDTPLTRTTWVKARSFSAATGWSALNEAIFTLDTLSPLRVTEIMYHPRAPKAGTEETNYTTSDFEFIEFQNTGGSPIGLAGLAFVDGIRFAFTEASVATLLPGERAVLVRNVQAFTNRYVNWTDITIAGTYHGRFHRPVGSLANAGEDLRLVDALGRQIQFFDYEADWYPSTAGEGYSLTIIDPAGSLARWDSKVGWRHSAYVDGSPGEDDNSAVPYLPGTIVINEALTHQDTDPPGDWIEIHNTTSNAVNIGNWYLSDDLTDLKAFKIDAGTMIPAGGYVTFTEGEHFGASVRGANEFALSEHGEQIYFSSGDGAGLAEPAYRETVSFGAADSEVPFGRYVKGDGRADFTAMSAATANAANADPLVGPVVFNEIMYNPTDGHVEFVELMNISGVPVHLFDPVYPGNRWRIAGLDFGFPPVTTMAPGEVIVIAAVEAQTFRHLYDIPEPQQVFGPYPGRLDNGGEALELMKPGTPDQTGVPYIVVDRVRYDNQAPWPPAADGQGASLERTAPEDYGNDVVNWQASALVGGTPGVAAANAAPVLDVDGMPSNWVDRDGTPNHVKPVTGIRLSDDTDLIQIRIGYSNGIQVIVSPLLDATGVGYEGLSLYYDLEEYDLHAPGCWSGVPGFTNVLGQGGELIYSVPPEAPGAGYRVRARLED